MNNSSRMIATYETIQPRSYVEFSFILNKGTSSIRFNQARVGSHSPTKMGGPPVNRYRHL